MSLVLVREAGQGTSIAGEWTSGATETAHARGRLVAHVLAPGPREEAVGWLPETQEGEGESGPGVQAG